MEDAQLLSSLPDDPQKLREIVLSLQRQRDEAKRQRDEAARQLDQAHRRTQELENQAQQLEVEKLRLEVELLRLKKWYYGRRADTLQTPGDLAQLLLNFAGELDARPVDPQDINLGDIANVPSAGGTSPSSSEAPSDVQPNAVRRVRRGRRNLAAFDKLPVTRKAYDLNETEKPCPCCGEERQKIGEESSWQIEYIPAHFERIEHVRIKYACKHCEHNAESPQITLADKPLQPIEKGLAGPGLLAYVVTSKYADYLPLYRLEAIFERNGFEIDRATQSVWCGDVANIVRPLYDLMVTRVLGSHVICTDDTVMPMLAPGKTKQARMWVYIGDQANPYNCFDFTLGRGRDGPATFLKEYKQTLLADAYGGYDGVVVSGGITRAGCWAHARRKFVDAEKAHPTIAQEAVELIRQFYAVETLARDKSIEDRLCMRQSQTQPILMRLRDRLWTWKDQLLPKHPMAEAVNYVLNQWTELSVFAQDGAVPIDNNISEREMKRVVLNRKNSLFVGNHRGGVTAAILSSLTSTCRRHGINPQHYLTQLLTNLSATPMSKLAEWLPDQWRQRNLPATA
jgi:transposase